MSRPRVGDVLRLETPNAGPDWQDVYRRLTVAATLAARRGVYSGQLIKDGQLVGTWSFRAQDGER